jgi:hypothetical protein
MMTSGRIKTCFPAAVLCSLLLAAGCAVTPKETPVAQQKPPQTQPAPAPTPQPTPPSEQMVTLALKFEPGDSTTYKTVTEGKRSVIYEGSLAKDPALKGGETGDVVEMTFTQEIQSINDRGNAVAKITIKKLKYTAEVKSDTVLDFDSSRDEDQSSPLARLIGQSYTIEITPNGEVTEATDLKDAQAAAKGNPTAQRLLQADQIKQRHAVPGLPAPAENKVRVAQDWSSVKTVGFGMMGAKSYEKIYVLKEIKDENGHRDAVVEMNAIPTAESPDELPGQEPAGPFSKMFDNVETYTGRLDLDLTAGKVRKSYEKLQSEWLVVDPMAKPNSGKEPDSLRMTAVNVHSLEKVD